MIQMLAKSPEESMAACIYASIYDCLWRDALRELRRPDSCVRAAFMRAGMNAIEHIEYLKCEKYDDTDAIRARFMEGDKSG